MKNKVYILICFIIPWFYNYIMHIHFLKMSSVLIQTSVIIKQAVFLGVVPTFLIALMMILREKITIKYKNLLCNIAALQIPVSYILVSLYLIFNSDSNNNPYFLGVFFFNGERIVPFSITILVLYILKWKKLI